MLGNAEERLLKRRIHEMEQEIKKLKRGMGKLKKRTRKAEETEAELKEILDSDDLMDEPQDLVVVAMEKKQKQKQTKEVSGPQGRCRERECKSENVKRIEAGTRIVVICQDCGSRHTISNNEVKD